MCAYLGSFVKCNKTGKLLPNDVVPESKGHYLKWQGTRDGVQTLRRLVEHI